MNQLAERRVRRVLRKKKKRRENTGSKTRDVQNEIKLFVVNKYPKSEYRIHLGVLRTDDVMPIIILLLLDRS